MQDCREAGGTFGIPAFFDNKVQDIGMEIRITNIVKQYDDGRMDIRTEGVRPFKILSFSNPWNGKLYAGGEIAWINLEDNASLSEKVLLLRRVAELYELLGVSMTLSADLPFLSFKVAHKVGLSLRQEYALLTMLDEKERIQYLIDHLSRNIPVVREMERTKNRIRMNGHFQNFDPLEF